MYKIAIGYTYCYENAFNFKFRLFTILLQYKFTREVKFKLNNLIYLIEIKVIILL